MTAVIDVSSAIDILLQKGKSEKYGNRLQESALVLAPDLYIPELVNTLWKYHNAKILNQEECAKFIEKGISLVDKFINSAEIWQEAFSEGVHNRHSTYDMFYLVTARRNNGILVTSDSALAAICKKNRIEICH